ncbi:MAG: formylglycine-generating enzyme family protein [Desulfococcaceae bacterium]
MGRYEVTQEEWYKIMGSNPSKFKSEKVGGNSRKHPVEKVSWDDVQVFIRKLNQKEGSSNYRLPTEAEWEYAARSGSTGKYCFGDSEGQLGQYAWHDSNSGDKTHTVGHKQSNAWGLYDMHGNVWEWVQDWYGETYYADSSSADPRGPSSGSYHILRGGGWNGPPVFCRSASRAWYPPGPDSYSGFRLVLSP